ncbi:MerR family transcriptional regulator [Xylanibacillus composti]|uniref:MerR family transcriptional regulator n=1 Tax=Xylanibacillus composti TaxID=1572762 RepID=A0A8J4H5J5_9BACL|nr:MerR family transcriptional regulator [Xylanibacillus composti]MDT9726487.1 MerR family transcriptional regulator [Xylanibacillus composti]GIQ69942.1 MerR family transcriptional regulator [Xylanibacillus composti]
MAMTVKEVADLVGISVRTLHHYDEIDLLKPDDVSESGYRLYSDDNLTQLQQILFFKELGFPLKQIRDIMNGPAYDRLDALELQYRMLLDKRTKLDQMIMTMEKTIQHAKGERNMTHKEKFEGFDFSHNPYEQEARERWGDQAVDQSKAKLGKLTEAEQEELKQQMNDIYRKLASLRTSSPESEEAQAAIGEWYTFLNSSFGHQYTPEAFRSLGQMYVEDERFTRNIDQFGEGLAQFMCEAMAVYADRQRD